jgi:hypothetical protein
LEAERGSISDAGTHPIAIEPVEHFFVGLEERHRTFHALGRLLDRSGFSADPIAAMPR